LLFVFVLFAPSDTGLIFRGKFKTSVRRRFPPCYDSSYCCFYLSHYEHLLIVKESLICVYEGSWRNCTDSFEPLYILPFDGRIQPHYRHLQGSSKCLLHFSLARKSLAERLYTNKGLQFFFGTLSVFFGAWASWFNILAMLATRLVHHESHAKKCDMNTSRIIFVNEPSKTQKITWKCLVMTLPDWLALPLLLRIGNCITVYHVVMSAYLLYDSGWWCDGRCRMPYAFDLPLCILLTRTQNESKGKVGLVYSCPSSLYLQK
jgi:hypothetical protein